QKVKLKQLSLAEAVRLIQVSERARQGRLRAKFMKEIRQEEEKEQLAKIRGVTTLDPDEASTRIQKVWRGYSQRKRTKKERLEEMIFLGMLPAPQQQQTSAARLQAQQVESARHVVQEEHEVEFQHALVSIRETIHSLEGPDIKESLQEQIRQWFIECQVAAELAAKEEEKEKKKKSKGKKDKKSGKKEKKKDKKGKGKGKKGKGDKEEAEQGWKMTPSNFLPTVVEGSKSYKDVWQGRDEGHNFSQRFDGELIKEEKRKEVEEEIRIQVDELMRQELKNLKLTVDREKGKKKKGKKGGKKVKAFYNMVVPYSLRLIVFEVMEEEASSPLKKALADMFISGNCSPRLSFQKKKKKGKKGGKKKQKKEKDLTANRTIESLYEELVQEGLLIRPSRTKLTDFIGEYSYLGTTLRQADIEPMPSLSDVKQLMALYGILPLGSQAVHEKAPLMKTLLLAGPAGVGKKMLVHALCTETGANLFNLSSANIAGKYPGKSGLQMMLHMVFKVARQLQPSVVWIGDAEKTFYKKVPKAEKEMEPKRLKKDLPKLLKSIKAEDRVLIVGTTRRPFDADLKPFCKVYKKILLIPRPDYSSRLGLWSLEYKRELTNPLCITAAQGYTDCLRYLLEHGARPNLAPGGKTALHEACENSNTDCAMLLLQHGANPNLSTLQNGFLPSEEECETPLHVAAKHGLHNHLHLYLCNGAAVDCADRSGETPLGAACAGAQNPEELENYLQVCHLLLLYGADANAVDKENRSPLHKACRNTQHSLVMLLLENKADINTIDYNGGSPLSNVLQNSNLKQDLQPHLTVQSLLNHGAHKVWPLAFLKIHQSFYESLFSLEGKPRCLQHMCRSTIRKQCGNKCHVIITQLPLPKFLQRYLLLETEGMLY
ncbi:UNVERIFIED_CONTAM: hypothetical protein FKN15_009486, partial [Acipenser sinensis]